MALINCPECNREISDKATLCPSCGYAVQESATATPKPESINSQKEDDNESPCPDCGKLNWTKPQIKSFTLKGAIWGYIISAIITFIISGGDSGVASVGGIGGAIAWGFRWGKDRKIIQVTCLNCGKVLRRN